ncbi:MAG: DUF1559 domain-containing protein [Planctomycetia bacterium]|nr:DUF1559 domain-containing protein [Planctomycetia bacterium]
MRIQLTLAAFLASALPFIAGCGDNGTPNVSASNSTSGGGAGPVGNVPPSGPSRSDPLRNLPSLPVGPATPTTPATSPKPPRPSTAKTPGKAHAKVLDDRYISKEFFAVAVVHPQRIMQSELFRLAAETAGEIQPGASLDAFLADAGKEIEVDLKRVRDTLEQVTVGLVFVPGLQPAPYSFGAILRFNRPYDPAAIAALLRRKRGEEVDYFGRKVWRFDDDTGAACFADEKTLLFGQPPAVEAMLRDLGEPHPLREALKTFDIDADVACLLLADKVRDFFFGAGAILGPGVQQQAYPIIELLRPAETLAVRIDLSSERLLTTTMQATSPEAAETTAQRLQTVWRAVSQLVTAEGLRTSLSGGLRQDAVEDLVALAGELKDGLKIEAQNENVVVSLRAPVDLVGRLKELQPALVARAKESAAKAQQANHVRQIGIALSTYAATHGRFPPAVVRSADGKPLYSWRVELLPYFEEGAEIYKDFKKDEPWDSEHNRQFLAKAPAVFACGIPAETGRANTLAVVGPETAWAGEQGTRAADFKDGASQTVLVVTVPEEKAVEWTRPADVEFSPELAAAELGLAKQPAFLALFADGVVREIGKGISQETLKALITVGGNEKVDPSRLE